MNIFKIIGRLFFKKQKCDQTVSSEMQTAIETWLILYIYGTENPEKSGCLHLPSSVASEVSRLVLAESKIEVSDESLNKHMQSFWNRFCNQAEVALAFGSQVFKPYVSGDKIAVDLVRADRYMPTAFDSTGKVISAIFMERKTDNGRYYTRLESHTFDESMHTYTVENKAYSSYSEEYLGSECSLAGVSGWEQLKSIQTIANVQQPLFAVFKIPSANHTDLDSPLGSSVYADACELFSQAERQWERLMWEFEGTELAIDASETLFPRKGKGLAKRLPRAFRRLFRMHDIDPQAKLTDMLQVFSPAIRDTNIFNGFNRILQRIEFSYGLAYGTISDPQVVEKTAEEIITSKQRSYVQTSRIQQSLQNALEQLLYAMKVYAALYELPYDENAELTCSWGDSVLEDAKEAVGQRLQFAQAGYLKPELLLSYYFGCTEEEAKKMMPDKPIYREPFGGDG